ncbi:MAG: hypothetical protein WCO90_08095, partial [Planctomycetota bacterium]
ESYRERAVSENAGGTEWELVQAEAGIVAAGTDMHALAEAQHRHAEAIRNMMQGVLVPSFLALVDRVLAERLAPLIARIDVMVGEIGVIEERCGTCPLRRRGRCQANGHWLR